MSTVKKGRCRANILTLAVCAALLMTLAVPSLAASDTAVKSTQPIYVDNIFVDITMYNINGNNYARLRDIGQAVGFNVIYDAETRAIHIKTGEPYSAGAGELGQTPETAIVSQTIQTIFIDGERTYITAYNIIGNNYVKLVSLGETVGFDVSWDGTNRRVMVKSLNPPGSAASKPEQAEAPAMTIDEMKAEIIRLTNAERVKSGVPELEVLPELMDCAQAKADDFINSHYYGHTSPIYGSSGEMIRSFIPNAMGTGENIAPWTKTPQEAFAGWIQSSAHLENILEPRFTHIGIGVVEGANGGYWWVQQFCMVK